MPYIYLFHIESSLVRAKNYCRNPDKEFMNGVWCYTIDPSLRWELCDVPLCGKLLKRNNTFEKEYCKNYLQAQCSNIRYCMFFSLIYCLII